MFYKHSIEESQKVTKERRRKAGEKFTLLTFEWFAEYNILHLEEVAEKGLPNCYKDFNDFLCDFWPDLPWNDEGRKAVVELILQDDRLPVVVRGIKYKFQFDMEEVLRGSIAPHQRVARQNYKSN